MPLKGFVPLNSEGQVLAALFIKNLLPTPENPPLSPEKWTRWMYTFLSPRSNSESITSLNLRKFP